MHVLDEVARDLEQAHRRGATFGGLTRHHVYVGRDGSVRLADPGGRCGADLYQAAGSEDVPSDAAWRSPERWRARKPGSASDQYALGAIGYEMIAGRVPFGGSEDEMRAGHLAAEPPPLGGARPECPPLLRVIVERMLAKSAGDRWPNLGAMRAALAAVPRPRPQRVKAELQALVAEAIRVRDERAPGAAAIHPRSARRALSGPASAVFEPQPLATTNGTPALLGMSPPARATGGLAESWSFSGPVPVLSFVASVESTPAAVIPLSASVRSPLLPPVDWTEPSTAGSLVPVVPFTPIGPPAEAEGAASRKAAIGGVRLAVPSLELTLTGIPRAMESGPPRSVVPGGAAVPPAVAHDESVFPTALDALPVSAIPADPGMPPAPGSTPVPRDERLAIAPSLAETDVIRVGTGTHATTARPPDAAVATPPRLSAPLLLAVGAFVGALGTVAVLGTRDRLAAMSQAASRQPEAVPTSNAVATAAAQPSPDRVTPARDSTVASVETVDTAPDPTASPGRQRAATAVWPEPGPPHTLRLTGVPVEGRIMLGDSARISASVHDARRRHLADARIAWTSSDTTRIAWRPPYAVARAVGGPVRLTARSGGAVRAVTLVVLARETSEQPIPCPGACDDESAMTPPSADEVVASVDAFVAMLRARRADALAHLLPADGDSTSARDFVTWFGSKRPRVKSVDPNYRLHVAGARATVEFEVRWDINNGRDPKSPARFVAVLVREDGSWRTQHVQLRERFLP